MFHEVNLFSSSLNGDAAHASGNLVDCSDNQTCHLAPAPVFPRSLQGVRPRGLLGSCAPGLGTKADFSDEEVSLPPPRINSLKGGIGERGFA